VLISVPKPGVYIDALKRGSRHGTIGGDLFSKLHIVIDYPHQMLYIEKASRKRHQFEYDMSGLKLKAHGSALDSILIDDVRPDSPAALAGVKVGDFLLKVNGLSTYSSTISELTAYLRRKDQQKIRMTVARGNKKMKIQFRLHRII
jgi:C-terminal processing protease CtpA/Prc